MLCGKLFGQICGGTVGIGMVNKLRRVNAIAADVRRRNAHLKSTVRILAIALVVIGGFDVITTNAALAAGHLEGNPLLREIQADLGPWWSAPKIGLHLALAFLILWLPSRRMISMARLVNFAYFAIIVNNLYYAGWLT